MLYVRVLSEIQDLTEQLLLWGRLAKPARLYRAVSDRVVYGVAPKGVRTLPEEGWKKGCPKDIFLGQFNDDGHFRPSKCLTKRQADELAQALTALGWQPFNPVPIDEELLRAFGAKD